MAREVWRGRRGCRSPCLPRRPTRAPSSTDAAPRATPSRAPSLLHRGADEDFFETLAASFGRYRGANRGSSAPSSAKRLATAVAETRARRRTRSRWISRVWRRSTRCRARVRRRRRQDRRLLGRRLLGRRPRRAGSGILVGGGGGGGGGAYGVEGKAARRRVVERHVLVPEIASTVGVFSAVGRPAVESPSGGEEIGRRQSRRRGRRSRATSHPHASERRRSARVSPSGVLRPHPAGDPSPCTNCPTNVAAAPPPSRTVPQPYPGRPRPRRALYQNPRALVPGPCPCAPALRRSTIHKAPARLDASVQTRRVPVPIPTPSPGPSTGSHAHAQLGGDAARGGAASDAHDGLNGPRSFDERADAFDGWKLCNRLRSRRTRWRERRPGREGMATANASMKSRTPRAWRRASRRHRRRRRRRRRWPRCGVPGSGRGGETRG